MRDARVVPAVSFASNGLLYGTVLSRYPQLADQAGLTSGTFGVALGSAALGGLLGSVAIPLLMRRLQATTAAVLTGCGYALLLISVAVSASFTAIAIALLLTGLFDGAHDVAMNTAATEAEQSSGRNLLGRMHAGWSLALAGGTALGAAAIAIGVPLLLHVGLIAAGAVMVQLISAASPHSAPPPRTTHITPASSSAPRSRLLFLAAAPIAAGAAGASLIEAPGQDWSAITLQRGLQAPPQIAALAPLAFSVGLLISRLALDAVRSRISSRHLTTTAGLGVITGGALAATVLTASGPPAIAIIAFCLIGVAAGPIYPLLFSSAATAAATTGIPLPAISSLVSATSRTGAIAAPFVLGLTTSTLGYWTIPATITLAGLLTLLVALSPARPCEQTPTTRDRNHRGP